MILLFCDDVLYCPYVKEIVMEYELDYEYIEYGDVVVPVENPYEFVEVVSVEDYTEQVEWYEQEGSYAKFV